MFNNGQQMHASSAIPKKRREWERQPVKHGWSNNGRGKEWEEENSHLVTHLVWSHGGPVSMKPRV